MAAMTRRVRAEKHHGETRLTTTNAATRFEDLKVGSTFQQYYGESPTHPTGWSRKMTAVTDAAAVGGHGNYFVMADLEEPEAEDKT